MAQGKKGFVLYADLIHVIKKLPKEKAGELFMIILQYVNDENPIIDDTLLDLVFEPIKQQLKRDLRKYETIREKRSIAGKASADKRHQVLTSVEQNEQVLTSATVIVNDIVTVKDNVKEIKEDSETFVPVTSKTDFLDSVIMAFKITYEKANKLPYAIINKGKERTAVGKLLKEYKKYHPDHNSEETLAGLEKYFDKAVNINDSWLRSNMSLPLLMSKFNEVNNILRNGKSTNNKGGTDEEFFAIIGQHLSGQ